ncbi:hypothetical protein [Clostridium psychrophilum]|uniref:hypothetical protein n=1 Tax=Clostridium psychrophilum TaxID=132926 RepID=UPI001C0E2245|nr:hypothetical protein [Clostridium psychrophilum]MBU3182594.1 hypothetical protein [Clostridium psychrophilum]
MFKNIIKKIPGFRTGKKYKMIIAIIIYIFASLVTLAVVDYGATLGDKFIYIIECFLFFGIPFILVTNVGNVRRKLPIFNKQSIKFNILGSVIVFVIILVSFNQIENLKSPEQKHLDILATQQKDNEAKVEADTKADAVTKAKTEVAIKAKADAVVKAKADAEEKAKESKKQVQYKSAIGNLYPGVILYMKQE